jgi:hypothetical protein
MKTSEIKNILLVIANDQCGIILTDRGSGSAGPGYAGPDLILSMMDNGDFDDATTVAFDEELARESFAGQCKFDDAETEWIQIEFNCRDNYRQIAWIWERRNCK